MPQADKVRVTFNKDAIYETEGPNKGPKFEKDSTYRMDRQLANRWVRRGVAEIHPEDTEPAHAIDVVGTRGAAAPDDSVKLSPGQFPSDEQLAEMKYAELGKFLSDHGTSDEDVKSLNSAEKRQAAARELIAKAKLQP